MEPGDEILPAGVQGRGDLGRRLAGVAGARGDVRAAGQEELGGPALPAVTGLPEGLVDLIGPGIGGEKFLDEG
jgi:hypothetical protein